VLLESASVRSIFFSFCCFRFYSTPNIYPASDSQHTLLSLVPASPPVLPFPLSWLGRAPSRTSRRWRRRRGRPPARKAPGAVARHGPPPGAAALARAGPDAAAARCPGAGTLQRRPPAQGERACLSHLPPPLSLPRARCEGAPRGKRVSAFAGVDPGPPWPDPGPPWTDPFVPPPDLAWRLSQRPASRDAAWGRPADMCLAHGVYRLQLHLLNLRVSLGATVTDFQVTVRKGLLVAACWVL
jgi:hypothetical protein